MKNITLILTGVLFAVPFLAGCEQSPDSSSAVSSGGDIVAVVNGVELPASRITVYTQSPSVSDEQRQQIIDNMIISEIISQEAEKQGFADKQIVRDKIAVARQEALARAYATDFLDKYPVDEARQEELYKEFLDQLSGNQEYEVAHILVEDEEKAKELLKEITAAPAKFAALAKENSADPGSAADGGKLGWVSAAALVPEFAEAMQTLDKGEISTAPVQTTYGWHIIRVDDIRALEVPELTDEMRERLAQRERAELLSEHIKSLRENAEVDIR